MRELGEETGVVLTPDQLAWAGYAVFDLVNPPRRELAAVFAARLTDRPCVEASDELVEVSWCDLDTPPMGHTPLDIAIARWAIRHSPPLGT